jgi:hypothetical protein
MRSMGEGASDSTFHFRRRRIVAARAPSTILRAARYGWSPFPAFAGQERARNPGYALFRVKFYRRMRAIAKRLIP